MKQQIVTKGIVLTRTDFQEADRILTILTPDHGKLRVIAKGVRRPRSKLAGGIELLSVSDITVLPGRGELGTLISTRLITHYGDIVRDIQRTMLAYDLIKKLNRITEDAAEPEYFILLQHTLEGLNDPALSAQLTELWFVMQLLKIMGHAPNLRTDSESKELTASQHYIFDFENMAFQTREDGPFTANHIKLLRLAHASESPVPLKQITDAGNHLIVTLNLAKNLLGQNVKF